ncbi:MAG: hypothetical protein IPJ88_02860 [Myxococcales bacterium]|nr:MAG: hypothetical protein IPJ88_02860 [Myxococcales bacterium]
MKAATWRNWSFWLLSFTTGLTIATIVSDNIELSPILAFGIAFVAVGVFVLGIASSAPYTGPKHAITFVFLAIFGLFTAPVLQHYLSSLLLCALINLSLCVCGSVTGAFIGYRIQYTWHLFWVAIVSSVVDLYSVFHSSGPSARLIEHPEALSLLTLAWPMWGSSDLVPILGVGDLVFAALYLSASRRHGLSLMRSLIGLAIGLFLTLISLYYFRRAIPALPFLGLGMLLAHPTLLTKAFAQK